MKLTNIYVMGVAAGDADLRVRLELKGFYMAFSRSGRHIRLAELCH